MNNSPASSKAKRLIRRCEASSATPRPESQILIGDLRRCVECAPTSRIVQRSSSG
jgi:ferredoxin-like protein FixX